MTNTAVTANALDDYELAPSHNGVVPYMPGIAYYTDMYFQRYARQDEQSNATALADEWPHVLAFLAK